jgi:hypothetical protein
LTPTTGTAEKLGVMHRRPAFRASLPDNTMECTAIVARVLRDRRGGDRLSGGRGRVVHREDDQEDSDDGHDDGGLMILV